MDAAEVSALPSLATTEEADELDAPRCDLCGNPSREQPTCPACILQLIEIGLEDSDEESESKTNENNPGDLERHPFTAWHYKHYDVLMRDDGSRWELGRGAMGITYKAFDTNLHAPVALKIINSTLTDDPKARERFLREARAAARLRHPNVATVLHLGWDGDTCFYAMEFIEGKTLEAFVARQGPLPVTQALEITTQTARALGVAQSEGLVHRDIKPANIMLARHRGEEDDEGLHVKVIDFGLAKFATEATSEHGAWDFPYFAGTPYYASPEQLAADEVDGRSDIYSLGVTLWYMLAGAIPLRDFAAALAGGKPGQKPLPFTPLVDHPKGIQTLLDRMLAPDKASRPQNAAELLAAIEKCKAAISPRLPAGFFQGRLAAVFAFLLTLVCGGAYSMWQVEHPSPQIPSIAVMPFAAEGENLPDQEFSRGVTKDLIAKLSQTHALKVILLDPKTNPPNDKWPAKNVSVPTQAAWLLKGSVHNESGKLRVSARLFDVPTKRSVWGELFDYDAQSGDTGKIRAHLVKSMVKSLQASHLPRGADAAASTPRDPPQADENYRLGQEAARRMTLEGITQALEYYNRALELAPDSARLHAAIAEVYCAQVVRFGFPTERWELAVQSAKKAIALAPDDPSGYTALSLIYSGMDQNWKALEQCQKAIDAAPNYAAAIRTFGTLWLMVGKPEKGVPWLHAAARLAPYNSGCWFALGDAYKDLDNFTLATTCFEKVLASDSGRIEARTAIAHILLSEGKPDQARQNCAGVLLLQPDSTMGLSLMAMIEFYSGNYAKAESLYRRLLKTNRAGFVTFYGGIHYLSALGYIRCQLGDETEGRALLREAAELDEKNAASEFQSVYDLAAIRAAEGKPTEALALLQRTVAAGWVDFRAIQLDPRFAALKQDPEFFKLTEGLREKIARVRAETLAAVSKPLKLADYPVPPQPQ